MAKAGSTCNPPDAHARRCTAPMHVPAPMHVRAPMHRRKPDAADARTSSQGAPPPGVKSRSPSRSTAQHSWRR